MRNPLAPISRALEIMVGRLDRLDPKVAALEAWAQNQGRWQLAIIEAGDDIEDRLKALEAKPPVEPPNKAS